MPTTTWDSESHYYSGQGVLLIAMRDAVTGLPTGFDRLGNVPDLKVTVDQSVLEHKESQSGARATDKRLVTETKVKFSATLENFTANVLGIAQRGLTSNLAAGSVSGVDGVAYLGKVTSFEHIQVSNVVILKGATPLVAWIDDVTPYDYRLNEDAGSFEIAEVPATAGLIEDDPITWDYDYEAQKTIDSITEAAAEYYLRFEGLNTVDGNNPVVVELFKMSPDVLKELSLVSDAIQQITFEGNVLSDGLRTTGSKFWKQVMVR